jgi:hypothetical protein
MSVYVGGMVIRGIAFEIHGERYMHPELDETGKRVNTGYDFYDVYTMGHKLGCLDCVNEADPFYDKPSEKELEIYLEAKDFFTTFIS